MARLFLHLRLLPGSDDRGRLSFSGLAVATGACEVADVSLRIGAVDGAVPRDSGGVFAAFTRDEVASHTTAIQRDWYRFLWSIEERYWTGMKRFLREDLHAKSLIVGTPMGWSPFPIQEQMDVIDSHAYWQHPHFPHRQWDAEDWTVPPLPMTGAADGGVLPRLALQRVSGMPYICTEYNNAAPNPYSAETFPLVCAYAAFQDWDAIFAFAYSHRLDDWAKGYFPSFFDIDQHPAKMATLAASAALFLREDVHPASSGKSSATVPLETVIETARTSGPRIGFRRFRRQPSHRLPPPHNIGRFASVSVSKTRPARTPTRFLRPTDRSSPATPAQLVSTPMTKSSPSIHRARRGLSVLPSGAPMISAASVSSLAR